MRLQIPELGQPNFEMRIPIRWGDMDAMSHVNNVAYFRYFEVVRVAWMDAMAGPSDPRGQGFVIANAFCNYLRQLEYPGELLARNYLGAIGRTSFDSYITLERSDAPGVLCATGGTTTVWIDFPSGRPLPLPDTLRQRLTSP
jgi:acyl-CoA thioester hydrolase